MKKHTLVKYSVALPILNGHSRPYDNKKTSSKDMITKIISKTIK